MRHPVSSRTWIATYARLFAIQGSWNYETMLGNGIAFCVNPLLKLVPDDRRASAVARQAQYFNAHPYLAAIAVGALARAELDGEDPAKIERFRTALCGPLGSVGDQLIWAGWLPLCSIIALGAFGFRASPLATLCIFLGVYNVGHVILRAWGLHVGLTCGMRVAQALGHPVLRHGPQIIARAAALLAGSSAPTGVAPRIGSVGRVEHWLVKWSQSRSSVRCSLLVRTGERIQGWRVALGVLAAFVLYSVAR